MSLPNIQQDLLCPRALEWQNAAGQQGNETTYIPVEYIQEHPVYPSHVLQQNKTGKITFLKRSKYLQVL